MVLICISLIPTDTEHLFICLWALCISFLEKCLFETFAHFLFLFFVFLEWICVSSLYFEDQTLVCGIIGKYAFPYGWFSFYLNAVFFCCAEAFYFDEVPFLYSSFMSLALGDISVKMLLHGIPEIFLPMFSSRTFMVSLLIFKSFIQLEFIFCMV